MLTTDLQLYPHGCVWQTLLALLVQAGEWTKAGDTMRWAFVHQLLMGSLKALPLLMPALRFREKYLTNLEVFSNLKDSLIIYRCQ